MGCGGSKTEEASDAVLRCRHRCQNLSQAMRHRYALAEAHAVYVQSLENFGDSLNRFFFPSDPVPTLSPALILPQQRKGYPLPPLTPSPPPPAIPDIHSRSSSGHIMSVSSEDDDDDDTQLHSDSGEEGIISTATAAPVANFHFAKRAPPSAVTHEQRPFGAELGQVQVGGAAASFPYYYSDPYNGNQSNNSYGVVEPSYPYAYQYYSSMGYGGVGGGLFGSASQFQPPVAAPPAGGSMPSTSGPPPDPPSPQKVSTWDFLNPFESYDYQKNYTPSRSSRELREEEGIPDLEDEEQEVVKEAYGDVKTKAVASSSAADGSEKHSSSRDLTMEEDARMVQEPHYSQGFGNVGQNVEFDVHIVSKNSMLDDIQNGKPQEGLQRKAVLVSRSAPDVVTEIVLQFKKAHEVGKELSKMLEYGKLQYHQKKFQVVSSRMRYITPSISTISSSTPTSKSSDLSDATSSVYAENDEEKAMQAGNLSSTLQKLYIWEKKLLDEIKVEEDVRLLHDRKSKKLRHLDERGAEHYKIASTRHAVKKLSTKMKIILQIAHSIMNRISKLRDEELWPQLKELIHGFLMMWQDLKECHRMQCQAMLEAKTLDHVVANGYHGDATMQLILELLKWSESFSHWVEIQKSFVNELNEWLTKYLLFEPEETADGTAPFSPGRIGAPPVFVICNNWARAIFMTSEAEADVIEAMNAFITNVLLVWQHFYANRRQNMVTPDMNRDLKALERDNQSINNAVETVNRKRNHVSNRNGYPHTRAVILTSQDAKPGSLHSSLQQFFEAMERFTECSLKIYQGLDASCEEEERKARRGARF